MKDKPAEKAGTWLGLGKRVTSVNVLKGDLLIAIPENERIDKKRTGNYRLVTDETITVRAETDDIVPLSDREFQLLVAIDSPLVRYKVFSSNETKWGLGLKPGNDVNVTIQGNVPVHAIIRCVVDVPKHSGKHFGVEIMVRTRSYEFCTSSSHSDGTVLYVAISLRFCSVAYRMMHSALYSHFSLLEH